MFDTRYADIRIFISYVDKRKKMEDRKDPFFMFSYRLVFVISIIFKKITN